MPSTANIGHPKLFTGGAVGRRRFPAAPTGNNFVAVNGAAAEFEWPAGLISDIRAMVFPPRRAKSANDRSL
jgi:hypothetical protein